MNRLQTIMNVTRAMNPQWKQPVSVRAINTHYVGWSEPHLRRQRIAKAVFRTLFTKDKSHEA